jgi:hypothetical protein
MTISVLGMICYSTSQWADWCTLMECFKSLAVLCTCLCLFPTEVRISFSFRKKDCDYESKYHTILLQSWIILVNIGWQLVGFWGLGRIEIRSRNQGPCVFVVFCGMWTICLGYCNLALFTGIWKQFLSNVIEWTKSITILSSGIRLFGSCMSILEMWLFLVCRCVERSFSQWSSIHVVSTLSTRAFNLCLLLSFFLSPLCLCTVWEMNRFSEGSIFSVWGSS